MNPTDIKTLGNKPISVLRLGPEEWQAVLETRRGGARFSLTFPHDEARAGQRGGLVLIPTENDASALHIGLVSSVAPTATFDSRVVFDLVSPIAPDSMAQVLAGVSAPGLKGPRGKLQASVQRFERVSEKLGAAVIDQIAAVPENAPALTRILADLRRPRRYDNARALQQDAVNLAIKAFGGSEGASTIALPGDDTAIATVRILEDAAIEHDARWMPGWTLTGSDLTGRATFEKRGERLDVFTANKRPLEELFGVDLIYLNEARGALVMIQYKMLETKGAGQAGAPGDIDDDDDDADEREWIVRINDQFKDELERMRRFDRDLEPKGAYRLNPGAFFFKFVRRRAAANSAGILLSLGHFDELLESGSLLGSGGGLRISYQGLGGHYLRSEPFVELVRSGYVGTRGATTEHLQALIQASLEGGKAVVAGIQSALDPKP